VTDTADQVSYLLAEADALLRVKRFDAAAERAKEASLLAPLDPRPFCAWSRALHGAGQLGEAVEKAEEAIRLAPHDAIGFRLRSSALSTLAREGARSDRKRIGREAVRSAREAVQLAPSDPNSHIALAQALPLIGDNQEANIAVQEAIRLAPNSAVTWVAASLVALGARNWNMAIDASRRALAIDPDNYAALNNLGVALRASGKRVEGSEALAQAARSQPDSKTARSNLSRAGLNVIRVAIMILLIPIGLFAHLGFALYFVFAMVSNVVISRSPKLALRLERWGAPIALFIAKRSKNSSSTSLSRGGIENRAENHDLDRQWPETMEHHAVGTNVVLTCAVAGWCMTLVFLGILAFPMPAQSRVWIGLTALAFAALATWPTIVVIRRKRHEHRPAF
jgi:tetratricopeptide (TPR) repeat protein